MGATIADAVCCEYDEGARQRRPGARRREVHSALNLCKGHAQRQGSHTYTMHTLYNAHDGVARHTHDPCHGFGDDAGPPSAGASALFCCLVQPSG